MKKKGLIIAAVVGILLVIIGISFAVYTQINNEKVLREKNETRIKADHKVFNKKIEEFNEMRNQYYEVVVNDLFNESVEDDYEEWITTIKKYENSIKEVEKVSVNLKELCVNKFYKDKDITNKCDAFIINYETVMNYYVKEITEFNNFIKKYNKENEKEFKEYDLKDYELVDINSDGKFIGSE